MQRQKRPRNSRFERSGSFIVTCDSEDKTKRNSEHKISYVIERHDHLGDTTNLVKRNVVTHLTCTCAKAHGGAVEVLEALGGHSCTQLLLRARRMLKGEWSQYDGAGKLHSEIALGKAFENVSKGTANKETPTEKTALEKRFDFLSKHLTNSFDERPEGFRLKVTELLVRPAGCDLNDRIAQRVNGRWEPWDFSDESFRAGKECRCCGVGSSAAHRKSRKHRERVEEVTMAACLWLNRLGRGRAPKTNYPTKPLSLPEGK